MPGKTTPIHPGAAAPWTLERLGDQLSALSQAMDALIQTAEDHTKMLEQVLKAAAAPAESSEFSPLNRNLNQITQLLKLNGELLSVICRQVGGTSPATP
ncbi:hypothetical protein [Methylobacterium sp. J-076]|uniref:hypothetical protein n=1 Tax=Methylobacterium sp. J-076 TaxID=2836655 RepID=UPI001FB9BACB|nr:hypothetical protein [Methylobacterium sp. J-076]MCJ2012433.1 hypothetical protein [Methylobacterium sp. J-076]